MLPLLKLRSGISRFSDLRRGTCWGMAAHSPLFSLVFAAMRKIAEGIAELTGNERCRKTRC